MPVFNGNSSNNRITGTTLNDTINGNGGNDTLSGGSGFGFDSLSGGSGNDILSGGDGFDTLIGGTGNDALNGGTGNDTLDGQDGNDTLTGGTDNDLLGGGTGNDRYVFAGNWGEDSITGGETTGRDTLDFSAASEPVIGNLNTTLRTFHVDNNYSNNYDAGEAYVNISTPTAFENVVLGSGNDYIFSAGNNVRVEGRAGDDRLEGTLVGNSIFLGGTGNDFYITKFAGDVITELAGQGVDTVEAHYSYTLTSNVENLILNTFNGFNATGNTLNNTITGNNNNNFLDGKTGNDTYKFNLEFGSDTVTSGETAGVDTFIFDTAVNMYVDLNTNFVFRDSTTNGVFNAGESSILISAGVQIENITTSVGNDRVTGNALNNVLNGGANNDTLLGGLGNDTYVFDRNFGQDFVNEFFFITNEGNDTFDFSRQIDQVIANLGTSVIFIDSTDNNIQDGGENSVTLGLFAGVENIYGGSAGDLITGNTFNNILKGNAGNDTLDGQPGTDTMYGGTGDDTFYVDDQNDRVFENSKEGLDSIFSNATNYTLGVNLENLTLLGAANINGVGNTANNSILGNTGNNFLAGLDGNDTLSGGVGSGQGNDTLNGGLGNDTYIFDFQFDQDSITSGETGGVDELVFTTGFDIFANLSATTNAIFRDEDSDSTLDPTESRLSLAAGISIENITTAGGFDRITGNALNNRISTNGGNDTVLGGLGNDTIDVGSGINSMDGGAGNDTFMFSAGDNTLTDTSGIDTLDMSFAAARAYVTLSATFKGAFVDANSSGGWNIGEAFIDYTTPNIFERFIGTAFHDYVAGSTVANTLFGGLGDDSLFGMLGNDSLVGDDGDDVLDGGAGIDTLRGGNGNDHYYITAGDVILGETTTSGLDWVYTDSSYTLGANLDYVLVTSANNVVITGNGLSNSLNDFIGNGKLFGLAGDDLLHGGLGNDTLSGGTGVDTIYGDDNNDSLLGEAGTDTLYGGAGNDILNGGDDDDFLNGGDGNDLYIAGNGQDALEDTNGNDTLLGGSGNDFYDFSPVTIGANLINDQSGSDILWMISANVSAITAITATDLDADGNVDSLFMAVGLPFSVTIQNYFNDTVTTAAASGAGLGYIETLQFNDRSLAFSDVLSLITS